MEDRVSLAMLRRMYAVHAAWAGRFSFACRPGCSACCTRSVTMTRLEGMALVDFCKQAGKWPTVTTLLHRLGPSGRRSGRTFNHFAGLCLARRPTDTDEAAGWDMDPCFLLDQTGRCSVYPARPFACRGFASASRCAPGSDADMAPLLLTANTVVLQLIEHLDSGGGWWGNMIDILQQLDRPERNPWENQLLPSRPLPGFLVPPGEEVEINAFLATLFGSMVCGRRFGSLLEDGNGEPGGIDNQAGME